METKFIINEVLRQQYMAFYSRCEFTCTCQFTPTEKKVGFPQIFLEDLTIIGRFTILHFQTHA